MARSVGLKQDTMLYKVRVYSVNQFNERVGYSQVHGAYETIGAARNVGANQVNWRNERARYDEKWYGSKTGITWHYEIIKGRMIWFEEEK